MKRLSGTILLVGVGLLQPAAAADLRDQRAADGFRASCEDLATFCFADACGGDQIDAAQLCRSRCPSAVVVSVVPALCPVVRPGQGPILRRRG